MGFTCTDTVYEKDMDDVSGPLICSVDRMQRHSIGIMIDAIRDGNSIQEAALTAIKMITSSGISVYFAYTDLEDWYWILGKSQLMEVGSGFPVNCVRDYDLGRFGLSVALTVVTSGDDAENIEAFGGNAIYYDPHQISEPIPVEEMLAVSWIELEQFILRPQAATA